MRSAALMGKKETCFRFKYHPKCHNGQEGLCRSKPKNACSTTGAFPALPVFKPTSRPSETLPRWPGRSPWRQWSKRPDSMLSTTEDGRREVKTDLSTLKAKSAASFISRKKNNKEIADPILVCTVLWSTLIWQLIRKLFASVCHLKKTAAAWRRAPWLLSSHGYLWFKSSDTFTSEDTASPNVSSAQSMCLSIHLGPSI